MGSTMMACPQGMDTEQGFLAALGSTTYYKISGLFLELYANEQLLARFEAIYL
jgi:heat shock protein HslJ